ncbi:hypothetical protein YC2023_066705 [Brassica napus]
MNVGPYSVESVPITYIPQIDCDKLVETYRHLKTKFDKWKFLLGHKMGTTGATHQLGRSITIQSAMVASCIVISLILSFKPSISSSLHFNAIKRGAPLKSA